MGYNLFIFGCILIVIGTFTKYMQAIDHHDEKSYLIISMIVFGIIIGTIVQRIFFN